MGRRSRSKAQSEGAAKVTDGNTTSTAATYDNADRLNGDYRQQGWYPFLTLTYGRDNNSMLTSDGGTSYGYDPLNRVTSAESTTYQYDKADQLTQSTMSGGNTTTLTYDIAGQLKASTVTNGQTKCQSSPTRSTLAVTARGRSTRVMPTRH